MIRTMKKGREKIRGTKKTEIKDEGMTKRIATQKPRCHLIYILHNTAVRISFTSTSTTVAAGRIFIASMQ